MNKPTHEELIISCLLQKPELFANIKVEPRHFKNEKMMFVFMTNFYATYKTLDLCFMYATIADKYRLFANLEKYVDMLEYAIPTPALFNQYQEALIKLHDEEATTKARIEKAYDLSTQLIMRAITVEQFKEEVAKI